MFEIFYVICCLGGICMADVEKVLKAKMYIDKLANGIDPVTNKAVPMDSTINNIHVSRCLFYVPGI